MNPHEHAQASVAPSDLQVLRQSLSRMRGGPNAPPTSPTSTASAPRQLRPLLLGLLLLAGLAGGLGGLGVWAARAKAPAPATPTATAPASPQVAAAPAGVVLEASGYVVAQRQATVSSSMTGRLLRLHVQEGARVRRGDLIAELDPGIQTAQVAHARAGVKAAEQAVEVTRQRLQAAERSAARDRNLADQGFLSPAHLDQSHSSVQTLQAQLDAELSQVQVAREQHRIQQEQLQHVQVRAPFDGIVSGLTAHEGEIVSPISGGGGFTRTGICTITDTGSLEGEADIGERYLSRLHVGQRVQVRLPAYPQHQLEAQVLTLPSSVDRNTAAARLRIRFSSIPSELRPGLRAEFVFQES